MGEKELYDLREQSLEPIQPQCIEWEKRVLHCEGQVFPSSGDVTKAYNKPTLPYTVVKYESMKTREKLTPDFPEEEIGGFAPISLKEWQCKEVLENQPPWRLAWFRKYRANITNYARAPGELLYCLMHRCRTWEDFKRRQRTQPTWLNYPLLCWHQNMARSHRKRICSGHSSRQ